MKSLLNYLKLELSRKNTKDEPRIDLSLHTGEVKELIKMLESRASKVA